MKLLNGFLMGFLMGFIYFMMLKFRARFVFKKRYLYYTGWVLSVLIFSIVFLLLNNKISIDLISFLTGILIAQISVVGFYFYKVKKNT